MLELKPFQETLHKGMCGPASLKIVLDYFGVSKTENELADLMKKTDLGTDEKSIVIAAQSLGFNAEVKNESDFDAIQGWLDKKVPVIVDWFTRGRADYPDSAIADGHYSVVAGLGEEHIYLQDPELGGLRTLKKEDFKKVWFDFSGEFIRPEQLIIRQLIAIYRDDQSAIKTKKDPANKPIIAVDIDDVIAAHALGFVEWSNQKYGTHLTIDDYQDHWSEIWKVEHEETERRAVEYHESGHIATYGAIDGAKEVLEKLKRRFRLVVLTTRRNSINQLSKEWIEKYYPGIFDEMIFSGFFDSPTKESVKMTKGELAKDIGADYIIDDQIKHVLAAAELGIRGILFGNYTWNKVDVLPENVTRANNWQEVLNYFDVHSI